jgi:ATP-dependent RNA helicase DDX3X
MSDFVKTEDMAEALPAVNGPPKDQEAYDRAREKGWSAPEPTTNYPAENGAEAQPTESPFVEQDWMHSAAKYEWNEEFGDVGPKIPELEAQLFNPELKPQKGNLFEK